MHAHMLDFKAAHVNAVQPQYRQFARVAACRLAAYAAEHFTHFETADQVVFGVVAPVVEVPGEDERGLRVGDRLHAARKGRHLAAAGGGGQAEVHAHTLDRRCRGRDLHFTMQQTTPLEAVVGDVLIVAAQNRKATENGIAMMAVVVHGVPAIRNRRPDVARKKLVLRFAGPVLMAARVAEMQPLHLLQEDDVHFELTQALTQLVNHHAAVELGEALVNVVCADA